MRRAPLWPDRVLGDLDQHGVAGLQRVLDPALLALEVDGFPVDFTGVEHGVAAASDVDEGGFHGRQHVLDLAQVDVADQGILLGLRHEVLGQDAVLEDADLDSVVALADDHLAVDRFAPGQELGLGDDGAAAAGVAGFAAALLLRLKPGGALEGRDAVVDGCLGGGTGCTDAGHRVGRVVVFPAGQFQVLVATAAAATAAGRNAVFELLLGLLVRPLRRRLRIRSRRRARGRSACCGHGVRGCGGDGGFLRRRLHLLRPLLPRLPPLRRPRRRGRTDDGAQVGGLEDHRGDRPGSRNSEAAAAGAAAGVSVASVAASRSGLLLPRGRRLLRPGVPAAGGLGSGQRSRRRELRGGGFHGGGSGLGAAGAAPDRFLNRNVSGRGGGLLPRGSSSRQPRRPRRRPGGVRPVRRPCGCGSGGRVLWPWLLRPEPRLPRGGLGGAASAASGSGCRVRCVRGGVLLRKCLAAGPDRPLRRRCRNCGVC